MTVPESAYMFVDPSRCIGCQACVNACTECDTHRGHSMIHLELVDPGRSTQTTPMVCMHCEAPTCAEVCPADAIKRTEDGVVQSARKPRCIACNNCVLACPFGVPKMNTSFDLMMKCDLCYDRSSVGKKPMCSTVCPSQALFYGTEAEMARLRPRSRAHDTFRFGEQTIRTKVKMMLPAARAPQHVDVTALLEERKPALDVLADTIFFTDEEGA